MIRANCLECGRDEFPLNTIDTGEEWLTDYFFSCAECDFSWYLSVRTDEHEDGASVNVEALGFVDEDGNLSWEKPPVWCRIGTEVKGDEEE